MTWLRENWRLPLLLVVLAVLMNGWSLLVSEPPRPWDLLALLHVAFAGGVVFLVVVVICPRWYWTPSAAGFWRKGTPAQLIWAVRLGNLVWTLAFLVISRFTHQGYLPLWGADVLMLPLCAAPALVVNRIEQRYLLRQPAITRAEAKADA